MRRVLLALLVLPTGAPEPPADVVLFFSSYLEGASYDKYLEIYNKGSAAAKLDEFAFPNTNNGHAEGHEYWNTFTAGATLQPGAYYIIAHPNASAAIVQKADQTHKYLSNGDDAYALVYGSEQDYTMVDTIGKFGPDPGSGWDVCGITAATKDHALLRKPTVVVGNVNWDTSRGSDADDCEWYVLDKSDFKLHSFPMTVTGTLTPAPPQVKTIKDIQSSDSLRGQKVQVSGVVTGVLTNSWIFMQATGDASDYSGLMLYQPAPRPKQGDLIEIIGEPSEFHGVTQIADGKVTVIGSAEIPPPKLVKTGGQNYELYEGMLVKVQDVTVTNANADADDEGTDHGEFLVDDGSGEMRVDDASRTMTHDPKGGEKYESITGVLHYSWSNFKVLPRDDCDLVLKGGSGCSSMSSKKGKGKGKGKGKEEDSSSTVIIIIAVAAAVVFLIAAIVLFVLYRRAKKKPTEAANHGSDVVLGRPVEEGAQSSPAEIVDGSAARAPGEGKV